MNVVEYLNETEFAVRSFYAGLDNCMRVHEDALRYWDVFIDGTPKNQEESDRLTKYLEQESKYFRLRFSQGIIAGAIFQVAATGIRLFSTNTIIPDDCKKLVTQNAKAAIPFCVGKRRYGLPIGLIIYAARNQYAHWEGDPHHVVKNVFNQLELAFWDNPVYDLAFDLGNPTILLYANELLYGCLNWNTYEIFRSEMEEVLSLEVI